MSDKIGKVKIGFIDNAYILMSSIVTTFLSLVLPFSILIIFDRVLPNQAKDTLTLIFAIIIVAIILDYFLKKQEEKLTSNLMKQFETKIINRTFHAICLADIYQFSKIESGVFLERISKIPEIKSFLTGEMIKAKIHFLTSILTITIIAIIHPVAGLILAISSIFLWLVAHNISNRKIVSLEKSTQLEGETSSKIIEVVSNPLDNKSRAMEYRLESIMNELIKIREASSIGYEKLESNYNIILSLFQNLTVTFVVLMLAQSVIDANSTQGIMAAVIMLTNRYFGPYQQMMRTLSRLKINRLQVNNISKILDLEIHNSHKQLPKADNDTDTLLVQDSLTIYLDSHKKIIIDANRPVILSGDSGTGKTSIGRRLILDIDKKELPILLNGIDINSLDYHEWRKQTFLINERSQFIDGTIIDNLTCYRPFYNSSAFSLCKNLGIHDIINSLPNGFYTNLSSNKPTPFSRQVKYALFIIRAMISNNKILFLDDFDTIFDSNFASKVIMTFKPKLNNQFLIIVSNNIQASDFGLPAIKLGNKGEK
ncbi:ABC transporter transmembrane domain-containing protein [Paraferrimonas sp. SM1919]|uniref:ABC transporter transmembrane domain-containing protein n=1 Tax=Paraferrimonas sp. SM1919 TaxID=2662263 RepID=UPI0013D4C0BF|nr:ABC transporter transmembrane domain-containing protein [Paraferrimonas sp. SM1919]